MAFTLFVWVSQEMLKISIVDMGLVRMGLKLLTLNVRGPSYLGLTRSISWLLMPWLLTLLGHQQPWYCLIWRRTSTTWVVSMWRHDTKCKYMFMFPLKNLARKGLIWDNSCCPRDNVLTHRGPVTHYCGGSILCKNPLFFTMKEFPQI